MISLIRTMTNDKLQVGAHVCTYARPPGLRGKSLYTRKSYLVVMTWDISGSTSDDLAVSLRFVAAFTLLGASAIHLKVIPEHFEES